MTGSGAPGAHGVVAHGNGDPLAAPGRDAHPERRQPALSGSKGMTPNTVAAIVKISLVIPIGRRADRCSYGRLSRSAEPRSGAPDLPILSSRGLRDDAMYLDGLPAPAELDQGITVRSRQPACGWTSSEPVVGVFTPAGSSSRRSRATFKATESHDLHRRREGLPSCERRVAAGCQAVKPDTPDFGSGVLPALQPDTALLRVASADPRPCGNRLGRVCGIALQLVRRYRCGFGSTPLRPRGSAGP